MACTRGKISPSANSRTASRNICSSSLSVVSAGRAVVPVCMAALQLPCPAGHGEGFIMTNCRQGTKRGAMLLWVPF